MTPVCLAEPSPMARARRRNDGPGRRHKRGISRVTKGVTWGVTKAVTCAAAPVEQFACRQLRFGLELRPPVTERLQRRGRRPPPRDASPSPQLGSALDLRPPVTDRLQRRALRRAILPLIQLTPLPRFMMRPPKRLPASRPRQHLDTHPDL